MCSPGVAASRARRSPIARRQIVGGARLQHDVAAGPKATEPAQHVRQACGVGLGEAQARIAVLPFVVSHEQAEPRRRR